MNARTNSNANWHGPHCLGLTAFDPSFEGYPMPILTFATKIRWTGSESSNTTNPKFGSFPPTPFVFMRSSTTFPKPGKTAGKSHVIKNHSASSATPPLVPDNTCSVAPGRSSRVALRERHTAFQHSFSS